MTPMIDEPSFRWGNAALIRWNMALMLVAKVRSHSSSGTSSSESRLIWKAALLTRMSSPPSSRTAVSTMSRQCCGSTRSPLTRTARCPASVDQLLDLFGVGVLTEVADQHVGALAGVGDRHGPPDPGVAPVINATLPLSCPVPW